MQAVQPAANLQVQEPTSIIFLGVGGVLLWEENRYYGILVFKKAQELFQRDGWHGFTALESRIATSHFFDETAVANLENLIKRCTRRVFIVIFSDWKQGITLENLRDRVFDRCSFSNLIIDKTPDNHLKTEAEQVDSWLQQNRSRFNIESFLILAKYNSKLNERFPTNVIKVHSKLSKSEVEKAHQIMSQSSTFLDIERVILSEMKPHHPPETPKVDDELPKSGLENALQVISQPSNMERVALSETKPHYPQETPKVDVELPKSDLEKTDQTTPPSSIIFLDVDEVIMPDRTEPNMSAAIFNKIQQLFGKYTREKNYTSLEWRIAASHFFSRKAVANLNVLVEKRSKVTRVFIVIISSWRSDGTIEELRERVFDRCAFSKFIIDKTPDNYFTRSSANPDAKDPALVSMEKYNFDLSSRALQVDFWLRENRGKYNIISIVILDDLDLGFSERFPKNFIQVRFPLSESDVDKADRILSKSLGEL